MSLFSFLRKNEQESAAADGTYHSRAEEDSKTARSRKRKTASRRDDAADPVLPEKKRARRRLVGAVALVLAAIIGLPMIFAPEPKPLAEDIDIQIPSRNSLPPLPPPSDAASVAPVAGAETDAVAASEEAQAEPESPPPAPAVNTAKTSIPEPATPMRAPEPPVASTSKPTSPAPAKPALRSPDGARALALLEGRAAPAAEMAGSEKFVVQVAALVSVQKVNELRDKLKRAGIESFTQQVATQSGTATRIRVGPFSSREEAEKMRARIVKLGLNGSLVPV